MIKLQNVKHSYSTGNSKELLIVDDINLSLNENEIVTLLGRSGSGKSTILRIIAGLIDPTNGEIFYLDKKMDHPIPDISMIFQTFALFPWLTVEQNVKLALAAQNIEQKEIDARAEKFIEIVGLSGYQLAFPRELSGGMKQRVGFARALAINPKILLMDEPFSALDILTAQALRTDFLDLWNGKKLSLKTVLLVTHNIEEAVFLSDRIHIFSSNPGKIINEIKIDLPHPRDRLDPEFKRIVEEVYTLMTSYLEKTNSDTVESANKLPKILFNELENFLILIMAEPYLGKASLPILANKLRLEISELLAIVENLKLLRFLDIKQDNIQVTASGKMFLEADNQAKQQILAEHLVQYIPFLSYMRRTIAANSNKEIEKEFFINKLEEKLPRDQVNQVLNALISWARYGELFIYNDDTKLFYLS